MAAPILVRSRLVAWTCGAAVAGLLSVPSVLRTVILCLKIVALILMSTR